LAGLLPRLLIPVFVELTGIPPEKPGHQVTATERDRLLRLLRDFRLTITGTRPIAEAIVTAGGIGRRARSAYSGIQTDSGPLRVRRGDRRGCGYRGL